MDDNKIVWIMGGALALLGFGALAFAIFATPPIQEQTLEINDPMFEEALIGDPPSQEPGFENDRSEDIFLEEEVELEEVTEPEA